ncbi:MULTISPECIES: hypothetical protein [unclassified Nocardia]|uniref:hypothetical protein n=1 Tax=unclassified Nocardia TaxID=2637762 RepID=UPI0024A811C1|nr:MULTISPECIES: hypothetical protein [unclassified Nocardia]
MNHARMLHTILGVVALYLLTLVIWLGWIARLAPPGTAPMQIFMLVGLFGSFLGVGMLLAQRPSRADRRLRRRGYEGWATIEGVHPLRRTNHHTELAELDLELVVPGSPPYHGTIVYDVQPVDQPKLAVGETISIRVDPEDRDRIIICL